MINGSHIGQPLHSHRSRALSLLMYHNKHTTFEWIFDSFCLIYKSHSLYLEAPHLYIYFKLTRWSEFPSYKVLMGQFSNKAMTTLTFENFKVEMSTFIT
jgi:hypothetical protein